MVNISLCIIEDDSLVRESLESYLSIKKEIKEIRVYRSMEDFILFYTTNKTDLPNIILLDIQLPGKSGIDGIPEIRKLIPDAEIIMLTTFDDSDKIFSALCAGACSYLSKKSSLAVIYDSIITVFNGGSYMSPAIARKVSQFFVKEKMEKTNPLTDRQLEIVHGIVDGLSYKMIGTRLNISLDTVRTHIMQIYRTLNINCKGQLIKWAIEHKV